MSKNIPLKIICCLCMIIPVVNAQSPKRETTAMVFDNIPEIPQRIALRMSQYQNTRSVFIQDWAPNGKGIYITTRFGETYQVHHIATPGGMRRQITFFGEPVYYAYPCPDTGTHGFLYVSDKGGDEFTQIYYYNLVNGTYTLLTDGSSKNGDVVWSFRGDEFIYSSTKRNGRDCDLYIRDISIEHEAKMVLKADGAWMPVCWSRDDKKVLLMQYLSANMTRLFILEIASGGLTPVNPSSDTIAYNTAQWSTDRNTLFLVSDEKSEFLTLRSYDIPSSRSKAISSAIPWNVMELQLSPNGRHGAFTTNEHGMGSLYLLDIKSLTCRKVSGVPPGRIYNLRFHPNEQKLAFVVTSAAIPGDAFVLDLKTDRITRWTFSETGGLPEEIFALPQVKHFETFDSVNGKPRMIPVLYFTPEKQKPPFPVLIKIHGGPESQFWPAFDPIIQYYINELGIAVVAPNVRGSAGYGKTYLTLDNEYKREHAMDDIGRLLAWIKKRPELDTSRICVMGGSYGGYMALSAMTRYDDQLTCGIDIFGISNFVTFLKNTQGYRQDLRRVEYGDERDSAMARFLLKISPLTQCEKITKPLFVYQGANDPRVPESESGQLVAQVRKNNGTVWYMKGKKEGHGFGRKSDQDVFDNAIVLFLEEYLLRKK